MREHEFLRVLDRLRVVGRSGTWLRAHCPAHDDRHASLSLREGASGRAIVKCHAGCSREEVLASLGLASVYDSPGLQRTFPRARTRLARITDPEHVARMEGLAKKCRLRMEERSEIRGPAAMRLGVTVEAMDELEVGLYGGATTWPMRNALDRVIGIRLRTESGFKYAIKDSQSGLFIPRSILARFPYSLILEGETDLLAALTLGFDGLGRPGCTGGKNHLLAWARAHPGTDLVIVADADEAGRRGAWDLAASLAPLTRGLRVIEPPRGAKDLRAALLQGMTADELIHAIELAPRVTTPLRRAE